MLATATINLRVSERERAMIDQAAQYLGKSRTAFILEQSLAKAEELMLDRTVFKLSPEQWMNLNQALDTPLSPEQHRGLQKLFEVQAPWKE